MPEEQQKTGEEDEQVLFASEGTLFQFDDQDSKTWRERGRGELRVNKAHSGAHPQHPPCLLDCFQLQPLCTNQYQAIHAVSWHVPVAVSCFMTSVSLYGSKFG